MEISTNDAALSPAARVYRASVFWKVVLTTCSALMIGMILGLWFVGMGERPTWQMILLKIVLGVSFVSLGVYCLLWVFKGRISLLPDQIVVHGPFRTQWISLDQLQGWRIVNGTPPTLCLYLKESDARVVKVSLLFELDDEFVRWLGLTASLDEAEQAASLKEVAEDESLGRDETERWETERRWRLRAKVLNGTATIASVWGLFHPRPYVPLMVALAALPWLGVLAVWRSKGFVRLDEFRNDARPNVAFVFLLTPSILMLRAVLDYEILWSFALVVWCLLIAGVLTLNALQVDLTVRTKKSTAIAFLLFSLFYGYGFTVELNGLHAAKTTTYMTHVDGKRISDSKGIRYEVELGAWGTEKGGDEFEVSKAEYEGMHPGDAVTVVLRRGWLGVEWYSLD
jgi:hypothetical protein